MIWKKNINPLIVAMVREQLRTGMEAYLHIMSKVFFGWSVSDVNGQDA